MKCPKCQSENPGDAKFCNNCANKLEFICPECGKANPPGSKFCNECAHTLTPPSEPALKDLSFDEKLEKIQKYLPKGLTEKILSQKDRVEGERKQVMVMFADMEGFTQLSERLGPEEAYTIMDQVYEILIHKVHDYEGTVNEFTGDGVMALFGAPIALEDAPQRAIRSAYAIHREIARFNDRMKQEKEGLAQLKMRIGIHTGPVVVGTLGNDLRVEFKAVGDTVNLASRIEGLAEPGATYVSDDTFKLTEGFFRYEALGAKEIKGKEEPVNVFRVIAPSTRRTRFDVSAERGLTPFVGRERELELLLDGFERAKAGRGQAFSIVAEAGVGKSRLLYEFRKAVSNEDVIFQEGKCLSYSRDVTYHPVIDIVKSNFDIAESDGDLEIREKLKRGLSIIGVDEASTLPYFLELLSVKDSGIDTRSLSHDARKIRIIEALNRGTIRASQIRPLILAIEDLHWIDKSSEDVFKDLLDSITGARVFIIFTYRPEFVHTWGAKSYHSQVNLNKLPNRESLAMVSHLLGVGEIDRQLAELILEKTEGVPFFIEEFIKSFKDLNAIERKNGTYYLAKDIQAVSIPSTIQDVIMARVDTLREKAKEVIQTGSVIEREFSYELIKRVTGFSEQELLSRLSILKDSELIFERGIYPESTYIFKHALTREVVYDSILARKKKKLHKKIGQAIEQLFKDNLHEHYGALIEHFIKCENYGKAAEYCRLAGKQVEKAGSLSDAIAYGTRQVFCLERLPQTEEVEKSLIDTRTRLGLYHAQMAHNHAAKAVVDPIVELAIQRNYKRRISHIYYIIGQYKLQVEEDNLNAIEYIQKALKIGEKLNDPLMLVLANMWLGMVFELNCEFDRSLEHLKKAWDINVAANSLWGIAAMKSHMALNYFLRGNITLAYETGQKALQIAEESGDRYSRAHTYSFHGFACYGKGYLEEAKEHLKKSVDLAERINQPVTAILAYNILAETYYAMGEYKKSQKQWERAISILRKNSLYPSYINLYKLAKARIKSRQEKNLDLAMLPDFAHVVKTKFSENSAQRYMGEILLNLDDDHTTEAEEWIIKAIEADKRDGILFYLGKDYALYAELFKRKKDLSKARESLSQAVKIFEKCGADGWKREVEKEIALLE
jgi:class 3 adenylate cyclase/tetratricopeptide (TPR) repeat protein